MAAESQPQEETICAFCGVPGAEWIKPHEGCSLCLAPVPALSGVPGAPGEPLTDEELREIERLVDAATPGPWELWSGCSWRRFGSAATGETVCEPTVHPRDGHPDLLFRNGGMQGPDAALLTRSREIIPRLVASLREARQREAKARTLATSVLSTVPCVDATLDAGRQTNAAGEWGAVHRGRARSSLAQLAGLERRALELLAALPTGDTPGTPDTGGPNE